LLFPMMIGMMQLNVLSKAMNARRSQAHQDKLLLPLDALPALPLSPLLLARMPLLLSPLPLLRPLLPPPSVGLSVGASVIESPEKSVGACVGACVDACVGACVGTGAVRVGAHVARSSDEAGTPDFHTPRACPLSMKSAGSHKASP